MADAFCHLHCHSSLSFKDGLPSEAGLVERAVQLGQPGIGLTNHGHLYGAQRFFSACEKQGIKGVIGMEVYEAVPHTWDPAKGKDLFKDKYDPAKPRYFHLTLWAQDLTGWENLCAIHTKSFTADYKPKNQPLVDQATLEQHSEGLLLGLGCMQSRTNWTLRHASFEAALQQAKWYFEVFEDRAYVEVMANIDEQVALLHDQRQLAAYFQRPTVGTNDVHYLVRSDGVLNGPHHTLVKARKFKSAASAETESGDQSDASYGSWYGSDEYFVKTKQEMLQNGIYPAEVDTSLEILDRVSFSFAEMPKPKPPVIRAPDPGQDPDFDRWLALHT